MEQDWPKGANVEQDWPKGANKHLDWLDPEDDPNREDSDHCAENDSGFSTLDVAEHTTTIGYMTIHILHSHPSLTPGNHDRKADMPHILHRYDRAQLRFLPE